MDVEEVEVRAYLYHRMFLTNKEYLEQYFVSVGVDWYVKLLRNGDVERNADRHPHFKPKPEPFLIIRESEICTGITCSILGNNCIFAVKNNLIFSK